jgi:hypothetical protein
VDPRVGLDDVEKRTFLTLPGLELLLIGRPAHSQSLYRLLVTHMGPAKFLETIDAIIRKNIFSNHGLVGACRSGG